jgi:hypothetical protein
MFRTSQGPSSGSRDLCLTEVTDIGSVKKRIVCQISMKIRPVGAELFHADGLTDRQDMTKLTVAFRNFANAPKKLIHQKITENCKNLAT